LTELFKKIRQFKNFFLGRLIFNINSKRLSPAVCFIDDDGNIEVKQKLFPLFKEYGYTFGIAVTINRIGLKGYLTMTDIKILHSQGVEVYSHGMDHVRLGELDLLGNDYQLSKSKNILDENNLNCNHFVFPFGSYNKFTLRLILKYYISGVGVASKSEILNFKHVRRTALGSWQRYSRSEILDQIMNNKGLLIFMTHCWANYGVNAGVPESGNLDEIKFVLNFCKENNIRIVNYGDYFH
jgi:peptidoglycan/xylan/chitin deacetylase (PgdA/CDA1 family)